MGSPYHDVAIKICTLRHTVKFILGLTPNTRNSRRHKHVLSPLLGTHAVVFFASSVALIHLSFISYQWDKQSGHIGCSFVSFNGKHFLILSTSDLACSDPATWSWKVTHFTSLPLVANVLAGCLLLGAGSKTESLRPSLFTWYTFLTTFFLLELRTDSLSRSLACVFRHGDVEVWGDDLI